MCIIALAYLGLMLINVVAPTGLSSPRGYFTIDWITLLVMAIVAAAGAVYFLIGRPGGGVGQRLHHEVEPPGAERHG
ncbi:MAG: hypothetical protein ACM3ML_20205 [Micromonosporaceae bacterium]